MGLRASNTLVPESSKRPQYVCRHEELCLSPEAAQHVYKAAQNNQPVTSILIEAEHAIDLPASTNPYEVALTREVDFSFFRIPRILYKEQVLLGPCCPLKLAILLTWTH